MIALCLQCCPIDLAAAMDLTKLICELAKEKYQQGEFFLVYRRDCDIRLPKFFEKLAGMRFGTAKACMARNHDTGWPGGSNMLAHSSMMEMAILTRQGLSKSPAYLLFEPDCVPLSFDWLEQLNVEWEITVAEGLETFGHWNMPGGVPENLHMNGNAVFVNDFFHRHPQWTIGAATQGWDFFYRKNYITVSRDSCAIQQYYAVPTISKEDLAKVQKCGKRPALLHGIKDASARQGVRSMLFSTAPQQSISA
jgi:hypothetical protein